MHLSPLPSPSCSTSASSLMPLSLAWHKASAAVCLLPGKRGPRTAPYSFRNRSHFLPFFLNPALAASSRPYPASHPYLSSIGPCHSTPAGQGRPARLSCGSPVRNAAPGKSPLVSHLPEAAHSLFLGLP